MQAKSIKGKKCYGKNVSLQIYIIMRDLYVARYVYEMLLVGLMAIEHTHKYEINALYLRL